MVDKGFNLFHEWDSKMYTSGSITNSQRMLTEINKSGATSKIRIWMRNDTVNHLKEFRIIPSEMLISLLILRWSCFSCLQMFSDIFFYYLLSYELKMFFQIFVSKVYRSVVLKKSSLWTVHIIFISKLKIS